MSVLIRKLTPVLEGGSTEIGVIFTLPNGAPSTPTSATYTLTDKNGDVVNGKSDVPITNLSPEVQFLISGLDLVSPTVFIKVTIYYTWLGETDIPQIGQAEQPVTALK